MKNKKIALFIPNLGGGGAERVMVTLANEFVDNQINVDLVLVNSTGPFLKEVNKKVNIVSFNHSKTVFSIFSMISFLRNEKPDVLMSTLLQANIITVIAKYFARVNTKIVLREAITASADDKFKGRKVERIFSLLRGWALNRADFIIAPSHGVMEDLVKHNKIKLNKISTIYNPVNIQKCLKDSVQKCEILETIPLNVPIILGIGRLSKQKDFVTLIEAFKIVKTQKDAILIILGEGDERESLEEQIMKSDLRDSVLLPGFMSNPYPFIKRASVYVLSSIYEGMPNTLLQALVFEKQIVSTDCPSGPFEILQGGKYGKLVKIKNAKEMAEGICKGIKGELQIVPFNDVKIHYDSPNIAHRYLDVLLANI